MNERPQFRDLLGKQGLPQDCFETCGKPSCFLDGCEKLQREQAYAERKLKEARAH